MRRSERKRRRGLLAQKDRLSSGILDDVSLNDSEAERARKMQRRQEQFLADHKVIDDQLAALETEALAHQAERWGVYIPLAEQDYGRDIDGRLYLHSEPLKVTDGPTWTWRVLVQRSEGSWLESSGNSNGQFLPSQWTVPAIAAVAMW